MPIPKPRFDAYANPVQPIVDAREESYYGRAFNTQQRQLIHEALDKVYHAVLRRDVFADVQLEFAVREGTIYAKFYLTVKQRHDGPELSPDVRLREQEERRASRDRYRVES